MIIAASFGRNYHFYLSLLLSAVTIFFYLSPFLSAVFLFGNSAIYGSTLSQASGSSEFVTSPRPVVSANITFAFTALTASVGTISFDAFPFDI